MFFTLHEIKVFSVALLFPQKNIWPQFLVGKINVQNRTCTAGHHRYFLFPLNHKAVLFPEVFTEGSLLLLSNVIAPWSCCAYKPCWVQSFKKHWTTPWCLSIDTALVLNTQNIDRLYQITFVWRFNLLSFYGLWGNGITEKLSKHVIQIQNALDNGEHQICLLCARYTKFMLVFAPSKMLL